jgi:N6-L-threonylcarbamoyladenine synthase
MKGSESLDFSFSGLKTALVYVVRDLGPEVTLARRTDLAASFQRAIVDSLMLKLEQALALAGAKRVALGGGVAANSELRERVALLCERDGLELKIPPPALCTDDAAMIASAARFLEPVPYPRFLDFDAFARRAA